LLFTLFTLFYFLTEFSYINFPFTCRKLKKPACFARTSVVPVTTKKRNGLSSFAHFINRFVYISDASEVTENFSS